MIKNLTCIECPKGCSLTIEVDGDKVLTVSGNQCEKGQKYAVSEVENPMRLLTSTVLTKNLQLKMIPIRTQNPIPKSKIFEAMAAIKEIRVDHPVNVGDIVCENFLNLGVDLIATRTVSG